MWHTTCPNFVRGLLAAIGSDTSIGLQSRAELHEDMEQGVLEYRVRRETEP